MKRFGDILRILSSVLVGAAINSFDDLRHGLAIVFGEAGLGRIAAILLIALFIRNIHGSAQYDDWDFKPSFEKKLAGRYLTFTLAIVALFLGPFFPIHLYAKDNPKLTILSLIFVLFLSPSIYLIWDVLLFVFSPHPSGTGRTEMKDVALRWVQIDMLALASCAGFLVAYWAWHGRHLPAIVVGKDFAVVSAMIILGDYGLNHSFYFPAP